MKQFKVGMTVKVLVSHNNVWARVPMKVVRDDHDIDRVTVKHPQFGLGAFNSKYLVGVPPKKRRKK